MTTGKERHTFQLSDEEAYQLVVAALELVGSVSPGVHKRIRRARETGTGSANATVTWWTLVDLVDVLNTIRDGMADTVIAKSEARRREEKRRVREERRGPQ